MAQPERPAYLPDLPTLYPRTDFVPLPAPPAGGDAAASLWDAPPSEARPAEQGTTPEPDVRVTLSGRLAHAPFFWTTPSGVARAKVKLAVQDEAKRTTYHQLQAYRERAEQLRTASFKKGDAVEVVAYAHSRIVEGTQGARRVTELNVTVVKPHRPAGP
jgi:hypothetical protein